MTCPRSQKQGKAGLEKPDGLGWGTPHLPNPQSCQLSTQAAKCMTHWPAEKAGHPTCVWAPNLEGVGTVPQRPKALDHSGPSSNHRKTRELELELKYIYSCTNHYKTKSGGLARPHPLPQCAMACCWLPPPLPGPSHSRASSKKPSSLPFQAPEEQGANPPPEA